LTVDDFGIVGYQIKVGGTIDFVIFTSVIGAEYRDYRSRIDMGAELADAVAMRGVVFQTVVI
jgi:hypothetical protein